MVKLHFVLIINNNRPIGLTECLSFLGILNIVPFLYIIFCFIHKIRYGLFILYYRFYLSSSE